MMSASASSKMAKSAFAPAMNRWTVHHVEQIRWSTAKRQRFRCQILGHFWDISGTPKRWPKRWQRSPWHVLFVGSRLRAWRMMHGTWRSESVGAKVLNVIPKWFLQLQPLEGHLVISNGGLQVNLGDSRENTHLLTTKWDPQSSGEWKPSLTG